MGCWRQAVSTGLEDLTIAEWDRLESFSPPDGAHNHRWSDHRRVINAVLYRARTGVQWNVPERFGPWETVYKRHRRWSADGTWMLLSRIQTAEDAAGGIDWDVSVDPTGVRAHQHAAGARKVPSAAIAQKGAWQRRKQVDPVLRKLAPGWRRWSDRRVSATFPRRIHHQDLPRRRRAVQAPRPRPDTRPLRWRPPAPAGLEQVSVPERVGRPRTRPDHVLPDKAYTSRGIRRYLRRHCIPERVAGRVRRSRRGGRRSKRCCHRRPPETGQFGDDIRSGAAASPVGCTSAASATDAKLLISWSSIAFASCGSACLGRFGLTDALTGYPRISRDRELHPTSCGLRR
ncbi:transposase [Streptomyces sp. ME01-18a]|uniref:transposase n=1 Tax=Streptomyces sp. ME01-18a TaxID=3028669 RepID=UPI0039F65DB5